MGTEWPLPITKGCKVDVRLLGWHHRREKKTKVSVIRSSRQLAPGEQATLMLQHLAPTLIDRKASQFYCFSLLGCV